VLTVHSNAVAKLASKSQHLGDCVNCSKPAVHSLDYVSLSVVVIEVATVAK